MKRVMSVAKPNSRINESYLVLLSRNISVGQSKDMSFGPLGNRELRQDAAAHVSLPHYSIVKEPVPFHFVVRNAANKPKPADKKTTLTRSRCKHSVKSFDVCDGRQDRVGEAGR